MYFDSKRVIFGELLDELFHKLAACVRPVDLAPGALSPVQQLRANVTCALRVVAENQELMGILFRTGQGIDPDADLKVQNFTHSVIALIRRALQRGMQIGVVRQLDDALVAQCIYGSVKEVVFQGLQSGLFEERPLEPMVDEILRHNLQGFLNVLAFPGTAR
jgi:AcrR family transcriptional regulator